MDFGSLFTYFQTLNFSTTLSTMQAGFFAENSNDTRPTIFIFFANISVLSKTTAYVLEAYFYGALYNARCLLFYIYRHDEFDKPIKLLVL